MPVVHYYESVFIAEEGGLAARFITLPIQGAAVPGLMDPTSAAEALGLAVVDLVELPIDLFPGTPQEQTLLVIAMTQLFPDRPQREVVTFLREVLATARIPLEQSPMEGFSFVEVFRLAGYTGVGAAMAIGTFGLTPVGIIATAGSIVLFGAAEAVSEALREGLRDRLTRWLRG